METKVHFLAGLGASVVYADQDFVIRWLNEAGAAHYERFGGVALVGRNLFDCHEFVSQHQLKTMYEGFRVRTHPSFHVQRRGQAGLVDNSVYLPVYEGDAFRGCVEFHFTCRREDEVDNSSDALPPPVI